MKDDKLRNPVILIPNCATCYNFTVDDKTLRKTAWLVPHVIKHREDSEVISWRCNWGNVCESDCIYAIAKESIISLAGQKETAINYANSSI